MSRPVLGVHRVVLDRGVEPQSVALLTVVEGALERSGGAGAAASAAAAPTPAPGSGASVVVAVLVGLLGFLFALLEARALGLGLQLGGDERVVLGAQVDLVELAGGAAGLLARSRDRSGA